MSRSAGWARPMRSLRRSCFLPQMTQASSQEQSCLWTEALRKCRPLEGGVRHVRGRRATVHTRACSAESPDAVDSSKRPGWIVASGSVLESSVNRYRRTVGFQETGRRRSKCLARISNALVATELSTSIDWPETGLCEVMTRIVAYPEVDMCCPSV